MTDQPRLNPDFATAHIGYGLPSPLYPEAWACGRCGTTHHPMPTFAGTCRNRECRAEMTEANTRVLRWANA